MVRMGRIMPYKRTVQVERQDEIGIDYIAQLHSHPNEEANEVLASANHKIPLCQQGWRNIKSST